MIKKYIVVLILVILFSSNCNRIESKIINNKNYKLAWHENFHNNFDENSWNIEIKDPGWVNNELQAYTSREENLYLENNSLVIKSVKEKYGDAKYTSARITTQNKISWEYGYFEIKAKFDFQNGTWPAIWLLSEKISTVGWPICGEIDIMEHINDERKIYGSLHSEKYNHMIGNNLGNSYSLENSLDSFNIYGLEWNKDFIKWYVNDNLFYSIYKDEYFGQNWPYDGKYFLIINQAIGGDWPGLPLESFNYSKFIIDWIKVYK